MSDVTTIKKNLLQDLMQRARSTNHSTSGSLNASQKANKSSIKSPRSKSQRHSSRKLHLPSVFRSRKDSLSPGEASKTGSLKENAKRGGSSRHRSKSPCPSEDRISKSPHRDPEEKKEITLRKRVLQLVTTSSRRKSKAFDEEEHLQDVLFTTFEHDNLKHAVRNNEAIPVIPWKTDKSLPISPGRSQVKVSYCTSCGHVDEPEESKTSAVKTPSNKIQTDQSSTGKTPTKVQTHQSDFELHRIKVQTEQSDLECTEIKVQTDQSDVKDLIIKVQTDQSTTEQTEIEVQTGQSDIKCTDTKVQTGQSKDITEQTTKATYILPEVILSPPDKEQSEELLVSNTLSKEKSILRQNTINEKTSEFYEEEAFESTDKAISASVTTVRTTQTKRALGRSKSLSTYSPEKEQTQILKHRSKSVKKAEISRSNSLQRKHLARRHTDSSFYNESLETIGTIEEWKEHIRKSVPIAQGLRYHSTIYHAHKFEEATPFITTAALTSACCISQYSIGTSTSKAMMPKIRNGSAGDIYPLLMTKIPEEITQEDGSVTFRKAGAESPSRTDTDRDSGVDVDTGSKQLFRANSNDSDFDNDLEVALTPDSALQPLVNEEFDYCTLKKTKIKEEDIAEEDSDTLKRSSSSSSSGSKCDWDMYALLKRFEYIEWELKPADNLKRQTLDLDNCNLDSVPAAVTEIEYYAFRDVEAVSLNHNSKIENADVLGKLADLRIINMWGCSLRAIPQTWSRLTKLQMLGLGNNRYLRDFSSLKHLNNIIWLDLGGCGLKEIPDEVTNMMKLKVLALGGNPGICIGDEICSLWDLKKLGLNDCELEEIPTAVFSLIKLTHLHLDNNYISQIDQKIVQLTDLEELTVTGNDGITFPKLLSQCDTVKCIIVDAEKDLTRISTTLKRRMKSMPTAMSPVRLSPPSSKPLT